MINLVLSSSDTETDDIFNFDCENNYERFTSRPTLVKAAE